MSDIIKPMNCAVYTRKSTSEGLEQDFNSLDAQREACMAFIKSQRGEGWQALETSYDDGGYTGANTDRPGLQRLIEDIKLGKVNCVVVYKVDRLSRSLLDFSQLLEFFDKREVSFVSVTQNFNTKTSMGRLTLNILLSFAQFEREIISERTRDKMAASRMKGKFLGGGIPFGYQLDEKAHKLVPHPETAEEVRFIFNSVLEEKSVVPVLAQLEKRGIVLRERKCKNGRVLPARPISSAQLYHIIHNPLYIGKVLYKKKIYDGEHDGIVSIETFEAVQELLNNGRKMYETVRKAMPGILRGLLFCEVCGSPMVPIYGKKKNTKHFYYICRKCREEGYKSCPTRTVRQREFHLALIAELDKNGVLSRALFEQLSEYEQEGTLKSIICRIGYEYQESKITVVLRNRTEFSFCANVKPHSGPWKRSELVARKEAKLPKVDKALYKQTLALQIREYMRLNGLSQAACARALGLTAARVSQLLKEN